MIRLSFPYGALLCCSVRCGALRGGGFLDAQAKKRPSGSNIADFYGRGDSDSDEEETAFNMDSYSKGVLLSQAAEVGTHTEDGQLRPQVRNTCTAYSVLPRAVSRLATNMSPTSY